MTIREFCRANIGTLQSQMLDNHVDRRTLVRAMGASGFFNLEECMEMHTPKRGELKKWAWDCRSFFEYGQQYGFGERELMGLFSAHGVQMKR